MLLGLAYFTSRSAMLTAPAHIPATTLLSLPAGFTPSEPTLVWPSRTLSRSNSDRPVCSANASTGTSPAQDTKFGSSNKAMARDRSWDGCHRKCRSEPGCSGPQHPTFQAGVRHPGATGFHL